MSHAILDLEHDLLNRARRAAVLEEIQDHPEHLPPLSAESSETAAWISSSAVTPPMHVAQEAKPGANGKPTATVAALTTPRLRSIVSTARQNHGPRRMRWETRQRQAWDELARRGLAA